ncbi:Flp family type IVb pilin [Novosphingobium rosa]|uniref:Flp family type IVb pilin n=1 Tax=Novosphingobium rosa TaxID=76978 RepID=UPI000834A2C6|nr:hypothetical protein [Novosphingobium rosa]
MKTFLTSFLLDEQGAAAAEYALILAVVGAGIAGSAYLLGKNVSSAVSGAAHLICNGSGTTCGS